MRETIAESNRRREKQIRFNMENHIVPRRATKSGHMALASQSRDAGTAYDFSARRTDMAADITANYDAGDLDEKIEKMRLLMEAAAKKLDFMQAAKYRDSMYALQQQRDESKKR